MLMASGIARTAVAKILARLCTIHSLQLLLSVRCHAHPFDLLKEHLWRCIVTEIDVRPCPCLTFLFSSLRSGGKQKASLLKRARED